MQRTRQCFPSIVALMALVIPFSLPVRVQAQTVTNLADFNYKNGSRPIASVVQATDGNFYGVTESGGPYAGGYGTLYRVTPEKSPIFTISAHRLIAVTARALSRPPCSEATETFME